MASAPDPEPVACPPLAEIEALRGPLFGGRSASDGESERVEAIRRHADRCAECRERLNTVRAANDFIGRFTASVSGDASAPDGGGAVAADVFPGYELRGLIAVGGQGIVHRAVQASTGRVVAIKVPLGDLVQRPAKRYRFRREVELTARLHHPAIVEVHGVCEARNGRIGCVMELVDGVRFDDWAEARRKEGRDGVRRIVVAARTIAEAIAHAHQNAVLHRDLKPGNVLITRGDAPRILDFGLAKALDDRGSSFVTVTGAFIGTLAYAAPEQVGEGRDSTDVRTDVHGLGLLLHLALAGEPPWNIDSTTESLLRSIREETPPRATRNLPTPDAELDAIVLKAMAKEKSRRYQSAAELADDLGRWLDGDAVRARFDSRWYVVRKTLWRHRRIATLAAAALLGASALGWLAIESSVLRHREAIERERADAETLRKRATAEIIRVISAREGEPGPGEFSGPIGQGLHRLGLRLELGTYAGEPEYETALREALGSVAAQWWHLAGDGEIYVRNALASRIARHGDDHPEVATGLHELATVLYRRHRHAEALETADRAYRMRRRHEGDRSPATLESLALRARARLALGHLADARADIATVVEGLDPTGTPAALLVEVHTTAAEVQLAQGQRSPAWRSALVAMREALGNLADDDARVRAAIAVAATTLVASDDDGTADGLADGLADGWAVSDRRLAEALSIEWSSGGREALASRLSDLTLALARGDAALPAIDHDRTAMVRDLLALRRTLLGAEHRAVGIALCDLWGELWMALRFDEAAAALEEALPILERTFGPLHLSVQNCHGRLSATAWRVGDAASAAMHTRRTIAIMESQPAATRDDFQIAVSSAYLLRFLVFAEEHEEAVAIGPDVLGKLEAALGPESHAHGLASLFLAIALLDLGRVSEAETMSDRGHRILSASAATPVDQRLAGDLARGYVLARTGSAAEAIPLLTRGLDSWGPTGLPAIEERFVVALIESHRQVGGDAAAREAQTRLADRRGWRSAP